MANCPGALGVLLCGIRNNLASVMMPILRRASVRRAMAHSPVPSPAAMATPLLRQSASASRDDHAPRWAGVAKARRPRSKCRETAAGWDARRPPAWRKPWLPIHRFLESPSCEINSYNVSRFRTSADHRMSLHSLSERVRQQRGPIALLRQRWQSAHAAHFVDGQNAAADQDLLDLRLLHLVGRIHIGKDKLQVVPAQALLMASRVKCSENSRATGTTAVRNASSYCVVAVFRLTSRSSPNSMGGRSKASAMMRIRNSCHCSAGQRRCRR